MGAGKVIWCRLLYVPPASFFVFWLTEWTDGGDDLSKVVIAAFERYAVSNPLYPDVFPLIRKTEAEIVAMYLRMYNSPDGAGRMTSGGTESIVMAIKTYRD